MKKQVLQAVENIYKNSLKKIFFLRDPEEVHNHIIFLGEMLGSSILAKNLIRHISNIESPLLQQNMLGMHFANPVGLSAGFDYEGRLTQILPSIGFGFETIGTITNQAYDGNPKPRLGRLPKSQSLMVNKGFKNLGAKETIENLKKLSFDFPVGISIGRSNNGTCDTVMKSIDDITKAFTFFEKSSVKNSYYELNISCPNLFGNVSFYPPKNLTMLLKAIDALHIKKPIFLKMPINESDKDVLDMLDVAAKSSLKGIIFGNLQKDRENKAFYIDEVQKFSVGNFSGKPTYKRSNELIRMSYKNYKKRFIIVGTGGVFSAEDAYEKVLLGASLVQLITGMIFKGPQLIAQINLGLVDLLQRDGYTNISEAIGQRA